MADDEEFAKSDEQIKMRRLLAEQLRKDFEAFVDDIWEANKETMTINEWRKLSSVWLRRPQTLEPMMDILSTIENDPRRYSHPSESPLFKRTFIQHAALDLQYVMTEVYRDVLTWLAWMSGGSRRAKRQKRVNLMQDIGLGK